MVLSSQYGSHFPSAFILLYMNSMSACRIWNELVHPMGSLVSLSWPVGPVNKVKSLLSMARFLWSNAACRSSMVYIDRPLISSTTCSTFGGSEASRMVMLLSFWRSWTMRREEPSRLITQNHPERYAELEGS